ncbi:hypothetical protein [Inhella gelatinilytica]|uniref:Uncharacterized protein n=1 Tax=Inhella gelatinilytica TaxID=2795030 RepID=A0A931IXJ3_9BURK|nr:hypothetical protein [Inhella gelatinilytica]MBH9553737.1 hypothetical protein [Inhella gelatinilytica]
MAMQPKVVLALLLASFNYAVAAQETATSAERVLKLAENAPSVVLPGDGWTIHQEKRNRTGTGIYYLLANSRSKAYLSAYIEKTQACQAADECLQLALKNESYKKAEGQAYFTTPQFKAARFFIDQPGGLPIKQAHILASTYVSGHWIDLHLSAAGPERPSIEPLEALLHSLSVRNAP